MPKGAHRALRSGARGPSLAEQLAPLKNLQVRRFSLYYFFVFGDFVAFALWTPHYFVAVYHVDIRTAGLGPALFGSFLALFFLTGVGNASTFQMIPIIMGREIPKLMPNLTGAARQRQVERESAAIIAFTSAITAYGAFFIPKAYGSSLATTGSPVGALWAFLGFHVLCLVLTWAFYTRRGGLQHDIELGRGLATPAE